MNFHSNVFLGDLGSESDVVTSELRKRKETPTVDPIETIPEPTTTPAPQPNESNEDKDSQPSETVKTHNDKKNE